MTGCIEFMTGCIDPFRQPSATPNSNLTLYLSRASPSIMPLPTHTHRERNFAPKVLYFATELDQCDAVCTLYHWLGPATKTDGKMNPCIRVAIWSAVGDERNPICLTIFIHTERTNTKCSE